MSKRGVQDTSVQSDRLLAKVCYPSITTTWPVTCSWLVQLDMAKYNSTRRRLSYSLNTVGNTDRKKWNLCRNTPNTTQRNQSVSCALTCLALQHFASGLSCCINKSCNKRQRGVIICCTPLRSFHKKKNFKAGLLSTVQSTRCVRQIRIVRLPTRWLILISAESSVAHKDTHPGDNALKIWYKKVRQR